jgi:hypothetical protein
MSRLYLWFNPCAFLAHFLHTGLRAQSAPGFPCALLVEEGANEIAEPGQNHAAGTRTVAPMHAALVGSPPRCGIISQAFGFRERRPLRPVPEAANGTAGSC